MFSPRRAPPAPSMHHNQPRLPFSTPTSRKGAADPARRGFPRAGGSGTGTDAACSVVGFGVASVDAGDLPAAQKFDPVQRRPAVPTLDKDRAAEVGRVQRQFTARGPSVGGATGMWGSFSPEVLHLSPSDARTLKRSNAFRVPLPKSTCCPVYGAGRGSVRVWSSKHLVTRVDSRSVTMFSMTAVTNSPGRVCISHQPPAVAGNAPHQTVKAGPEA